MQYWIKRSVIFALMLCVLGIIPAQAQANLLANPGFESNYTGRGRGDFNFPESWGGWYTEAPRSESWMNQPPNAFPHTSYFKYGGASALSISKGGGTFTAATYQEVGDIPAGAIVRGSAYVFIENSSGGNSQVRIGVGSNVGSNPNGAITWSGWMTTLNQYQQISVDHVATGGSVTIFIYATQTWPKDPNAVYIDDASLVIIGEGEAPADSGGDDGDGGSVNVPAPPVSGVGFVSPQDTDEEDGITHTVVAGDTIASIAVAYGVTVDDILNLNSLDRGAFLQIGQVLTIIASEEEPTPVVPTETEEVEAPANTEEPDDTDAEAQSSEDTEDPAESPTPADTPTETAIPDTPTPAPPAPVTEADLQGVDPTDLDPGICVRIFEDNNQNGVLEPNEPNVANGVIVVTDSDDTERETYTTDAESEPFCFDELEAGRYTLTVTPPEGYGLTTAAILHVNLAEGKTISVNIGAKLGLEAPAIPTLDINPTPEPETGTTDADNDLSELSGLIVFGLAGVVLVIGMGASLIMRGR